MTGDYGASIPADTIKSFERTILNFRQAERDKMLARNLNTLRTVGPAIQTDVVTYWEKKGGNANILAAIKAKGAAADLVGASEDQKSYPMYKLTVGFNYNVRDIGLDPALYTRNVEICTREVRRLEDYLWINGSTAPALTGIITAARANEKGKVAAYGTSSSPPSCDSIGNWAGTDTYIDIYKDVLQAWSRLDDNFEAMYIGCTKATAIPLRSMDDMRNKYSDQILDLFGATSLNDVLRTSEYWPAGYVYVIAKDPEGSEFVISEDLKVKAYAEQPGEVIPVELIEWINPCELHKNTIAAEIYTL